MGARWLIVGLLLMAGCAWEQDYLEKERVELVKKREIQERERPVLQGQWGGQPDTMKRIHAHAETDGRIREIDRMTGKW